MTETEWHTSTDLLAMARQLGETYPAGRKMLLFGCACCRHVWDDLHHTAMRNAVTVAEQFADGCATEDELRAAAQAARAVPDAPFFPGARATAQLCRRDGASVGRWAVGAGYLLPPREVQDARATHFAMLLRDVFGNPFRPATFAPAWRTDTAVALAQGIYEERAFDQLPLLMDALMDAGCDNDDILSHCRSGGPHSRGCWVVDLILGKS